MGVVLRSSSLRPGLAQPLERLSEVLFRNSVEHAWNTSTERTSAPLGLRCERRKQESTRVGLAVQRQIAPGASSDLSGHSVTVIPVLEPRDEVGLLLA